MGPASWGEPAPRRSAVLVVLDGLGDRPSPETGGRSPVAAASTPNLDRLSARGAVGTVSLLGPGVAPESDAGVFALLGYDPVHDSPGRGVLEALGVEIPLRPGDVALRLNFATLDAEGRVLDARVGRSLSTEEAVELARAVTAADLLRPERIRAELRATVGHRGVLWLRSTDGAVLSPDVSNADPFYERVGGMGQARHPTEPRLETVRPLDASAAAARTATAINLLLGRIGPVLDAHPVNRARASTGARQATGVLLRNAGSLPSRPVVSFRERHGVAGAALTEMPVERGIARLLTLEDRYVGPMVGDRDAGYRARAAATRELLGRHPFVYVHLKGPDEPGHDGDARRKQAIVEEIDRSFFGPFLEGLDLDTTSLAVTADHATPCVLHAHADDPVPWLQVGGAGGADRSAGHGRFAEAVASPERPPLPAVEVVPRLLRAAGLPSVP